MWELRTPTVGRMHSHNQQGYRPFCNLYTRDITYVYKGLGLLCPLCTSYACIHIINRVTDHFVTCTQGTSHTYIKALAFYVPCVQVTKWSVTLSCDQPSVFLAPTQGKSNLLIYGMQMHHLQSILRCEKVIGRPCVLPCNWMICINYYSLCSS